MSIAEFKNFFSLIKFCVTSRTYSPLDGDRRISVCFALVAIHLILFNCAIVAQLVETFNDNEVQVMNKLYMMIVFEGTSALLLKNFGSIPFIKEFKDLLEWIQKIHTELEGNEIVQCILNEEIDKAMKYSKMFIWIYSILYIVSPLSAGLLFCFKRIYIILLPGLDPNIYHNTYWITQAITSVTTGTWTSISNASVIVIGIYLVFYVRVLNRIVQCISHDQDKLNYCPDLLVRALKKHLEIIRIFNIFNETLKFMSIIQLSMSTMIFLTILSAIQIYRDDYVMYLIFVTVQVELFLFCLFGEIIRSETENIFNNLYQTNWYDLTQKDRKTILFMMMISYNSLGLKAARMYDVSLSAFVQILKLAVSYSALMLTIIN
ncbi:Odorant receptor [Sergentomyia squamirostris]